MDTCLPHSNCIRIAWKTFLGESDPQPKTKKRAGESDDGQLIKELVTILAKLGLKNAQGVRVITGSLFACISTDEKSEVAC